MSAKKIIIIISIIAVLGFMGWYIYEITHDDDRTRLDSPVSEPVGDVEPVLEVVSENLGLIWAIDFIPESTKLLATENNGVLYLVDSEDQTTENINGVPTVDSSGQGGLLDVTVSPDFNDNSYIYLTYSTNNDTGLKTTHLARAELDIDRLQLNNLEVLYIAEPFLSGDSHFGSRVIIKDDYLHMSIGDRGDKNFDNHTSQDTSNVLGTTIRLTLDGDIPSDNPFVNDPNVLDEIYTYGHRNVQGMAIEPDTNRIWQSEHGERDGDEINILQTGGNYGWPITTYGCDYVTRESIGEFPEDREDTINPVYYWECQSGGFPPAGMTFYDGDGFIDWQGDLFIGGLASEYLAHFRVNGDEVEELEPLLKEEGWRVRDVTVGEHDGAIYAAVEGRNISIVRIKPEPTK